MNRYLLKSGDSFPELMKFLPGEEFLPSWEPLI